ncbi:hypothetical protein QTP70_002126 [Hemibagrus guttatus]|uniref:Uncharacterized protein n=1 Tax=Hemibagrus guttatus TaxID=175788 RepID=A0AAE0QXX5_9TELE|nr:hypothetical protein QTP70_002126 [Hemibagrus guttatus]
MTTARYRPTWDLALDPLVSCKLCLGEFPLEQMTTITQCQCVFCTLIECMVASEIMQRYRKLQFEKENLNIFSSATSSSDSCLFLSDTVSKPYSMAALTTVLYTFPLILADIF